jgi:class 3 adenylate cyclase/hemoglobin-like flavoprotein
MKRTAPQIEFVEDQKVMAVQCLPESQSLLEASLAAGLPHFHACGGQARCSTCRVLVLDGLESFGPRSPEEAELAAQRCWPDAVRLACQSHPTGPAKVRRLVHDPIDADLASGGTDAWPAAEEKNIGLLFCDISDFTRIAEGQLAYDLVHSLNRFFKQLGDPIVANHGVINKYLGDGMLALFGLDSPTPDECARQAVRASLRMIAAAKNLNEYLQDRFGFSFEPRIGLHYGSVVVGQLGHPDNIDFTVIGDAVNTASRIEAANKNHGTSLLASEDLVGPILPSLEIGRSFETQLRGRTGSVRLFEILGFLESDPIFLVQSTFEIIAPKADAFAADFYRRLFALHPEIEFIFDGVEMATMRQMLMRMIGIAVRGLHHLPQLLPELRALGIRHAGYGVRAEHFDSTEDALLHALAVHLGEAFRADVREGWREVFGLIRRAMLSGFAAVPENCQTSGIASHPPEPVPRGGCLFHASH